MKWHYSIEESAQVGDWLAGFAGTLAFLWLIASFQQQKNQLSIQSEELKLQREAIQLQAKELKNIGKFSALEQVSRIVDSAIKDIEASTTSIKNYTELINLFTRRDFFENLETFFDSLDKKLIIDKYQEWVIQEAEVRKFVARISTALKIYLEQSSEETIDYDLDDVQFLHNNLYHIKYIPYLNETYVVMQNLVMLLITMKSILKKIQLAGWCASTIDMDANFQNEMDKMMLNDLVKDIDNAKLEYPEIYKLYKNIMA
ncbi:hypothetical protein [Candidatus Sulfurimonas baltica]|uniref:Phage abortive infection protein n=1 Tax=Candidatus Sulfurimonas baltica TaxID=2740404 RepID=A0A7S7LUH8_9BACT|nr:hypothetical protein [Candidatus Sulfurimonas baltica]QOY51706.1 hypothetical protein HUE88_11460 [Candidatus Sulfurimonas baltica]